jgi:hypothetical protein
MTDESPEEQRRRYARMLEAVRKTARRTMRRIQRLREQFPIDGLPAPDSEEGSEPDQGSEDGQQLPEADSGP